MEIIVNPQSISTIAKLQPVQQKKSSKVTICILKKSYNLDFPSQCRQQNFTSAAAKIVYLATLFKGLFIGKTFK